MVSRRSRWGSTGLTGTTAVLERGPYGYVAGTAWDAEPPSLPSMTS